MASGKSTREYLTIRRNLPLIIDSLAATVDPTSLALKLLAVDLITDDVVGHASVTRVSTRERIQPIAMVIMSQIQLDVSNYQVLMSVLRIFHPHLALRLEKFYTSDLELNVVNTVTDVEDWQALAQQLDYDPIHQHELRTSGQNQDHCRKEMLTTWARKDQRSSWRKLAEALDRMEQQQIAQRIREEFIPAIDNQDQIEKTDGKQIDTPTPTPSISRYGEYLRGIYTRRLLPYESKYRPKSTQKYINLAMISKHKESRAEMDTFTRATIRGDVDDVVETKTAITQQDIGRLEDGSPAQCILVQGAPGVGKTTLAWELCRQWDNGTLFSEYSLVVLLKMRDQSIQKATDISDLFKHPDPELRTAVCKDVLERNGKSVLILLEGYDELPPDLQERSIFSALIEGKELPKATILITSRTSSSDIVYTKCKTTKFQHIEVVGFTGEQIESYIKNTVADEKVLEAFRHYLKKYPHIHGLMYIPLNSVIILDVFISSSDDEDPPTTQTELYTVLTKTILCRYLSSHPVHGKQKWCLSEFSDLPADVHSNFLQLCEIAYTGICSNRLIFSDIPADQETLGLMQSVPELYESKATTAVSHNFLHLTLQEFLSAIYISGFSQDVFVKTLENMFGKKHLAVVLRFLAGLTKLAPQKGSFTSKARAFFSKSPIQCVKLLQRDALGFIDTIHWLFEAQEKELLLQVLGRNIQDRNLSSQFLSPFDCYVFGFCIANSQCTWKLNLKSCSITEEGMSMFTSNGNGCLHGVSVLNLDRNGIGNQGGSALSIALKGSAVLGELRLGLCSIGLEGVTKLTETLKTIRTLQVLDISGSTVGLTAGKNLAQIVTNGNLRELNISYCSIGSATTCDLARALHDNSQLRDLRLRGNPIGRAGAEAISSMLQHNHCLKSLDLTGCSSIGETGVQKLIMALCQNVSLKVLQLPDNLCSTGKATEGYDSVQPRIQWTSDISTQEVVELTGDISSFIDGAMSLQEMKEKPHQHIVKSQGQSTENVKTTEYLRGVEVIAETQFIVKGKHSQTFKWEGHGLKLSMPEGAVPSESVIYIKACLAGKFELPSRAQLVSPVYWLYCDNDFQHPVTLELQHCVAMSEISSLRFIVAKCSQEEFPYKFKYLDRGIFSQHSSYGSIDVKQFSLFGLVVHWFVNLLQLQTYFAQLFYFDKGDNTWQLDFVITWNLELWLTHIQQIYASVAVKGPATPLQFEEESISLAIPENCITNGWAITPLNAQVITKQQVDSYTPGQGIPSCQLEIQLRTTNSPDKLSYKLILEGAKPPHNFLTVIRYPVYGTGHGRIRPQQLEGTCIQVPTLDNLVGSVRTIEWFRLGLKLEIQEDTLAVIERNRRHDASEALREVLREWLRVCENPTWVAMVDALRQIGEGNLARRLEDTFCRP